MYRIFTVPTVPTVPTVCTYYWVTWPHFSSESVVKLPNVWNNICTVPVMLVEYRIQNEPLLTWKGQKMQKLAFSSCCLKALRQKIKNSSSRPQGLPPSHGFRLDILFYFLFFSLPSKLSEIGWQVGVCSGNRNKDYFCLRHRVSL